MSLDMSIPSLLPDRDQWANYVRNIIRSGSNRSKEPSAIAEQPSLAPSEASKISIPTEESLVGILGAGNVVIIPSYFGST